MSPARILLTVALLAVGIVSFVFVRGQQGDGATFVSAQRAAQVLTPQAVAAVVRVAPDPATGQRGRGAVCTPLGSGELHNPWRCTIDYSIGQRIEWMVHIRLSGSYVGTDRIDEYQGQRTPAGGEITGCCIAVP